MFILFINGTQGVGSGTGTGGTSSTDADAEEQYRQGLVGDSADGSNGVNNDTGSETSQQPESQAANDYAPTPPPPVSAPPLVTDNDTDESGYFDSSTDFNLNGENDQGDILHAGNGQYTEEQYNAAVDALGGDENGDGVVSGDNVSSNGGNGNPVVAAILRYSEAA